MIDIVMPIYGMHHLTQQAIDSIYSGEWEIENVRVILIDNNPIDPL